MPLAQSSELPPPRPMIESIPSGAANARPASTIAVGVLAEVVERDRPRSRAVSSSAHSRGDMPAWTTPASATSSVPSKPELARELAEPGEVPGPKTTRVRG